MPVPPGLSQKDADQVLRAVIDDDTNRLRVDAVISPDGHDLEINHEDDSIAIGTPTELFTATDVGSKVGLDVNVINPLPLDVDISAASGDNIAIADQSGSNFLTVNPDGSINITDNGGSLTVDGSVAITNFPATQDVNIISSVEIEIKNDSGNPIPVSGTVAATQSGAWNINNITGTVSLPTGASTLSAQNTGNASLASIDTKLTSPIAVTGPLTDAQLRATPVPISGTVTTSPNVNVHDGAGNSIGSTGTSLNVDVTNTVGVTQSTSPWVVSGTVTSNIGTTGGLALDSTVAALLTNAELRASPVPVSGTVTANAGTGTFLVDGSAHTQPVSGTVTANQGTSPWVISGAVSQSGTWDINNINGTVSLPTGASTLAAQNTGNTSLASIDSKLTSPIAVTGPLTDTQLRATAVPVSGTITANQGTSPWVTSGTVTANAGTNLNTSALALDTSVNGLLLSQGSTTSGEKGPLMQGAVTTAAPTYVTGQTDPLSLTTTGSLRVDGSGSTQPISGTVAATQSGTWNIGTLTSITNPLPSGTNVIGHVITDSGSVTNATLSAETTKVIGTVNQGTSPWVVSGTVTTNQGTSPWVTSVNNLPATVDTNYGTVGASTIRTAAEIGNATGAANFGTGVTGAQTLRASVNAGTGTLTDRSGTATSASTQIMAANANRRYLFIQASGGGDIFINFTTAAVASDPSILIKSNGAFTMENSFVSTEAVNVIRVGNANLTYTAKEG